MRFLNRVGSQIIIIILKAWELTTRNVQLLLQLLEDNKAAENLNHLKKRCSC